MRADQWLSIMRSVESLWGPSKRWDAAEEQAFSNRVNSLDYEYGRVALEQLATELPSAPAVTVLLTRAWDLQERERRLQRGFDCAHQNWGFSDLLDTRDGRRLGVCAGCGTEKWFAIADLQTATEQGIEGDQFQDLGYAE